MNVVLGLILLCLSTFVGVKLANKYTIKKEYYNDFCAFNKKLKNEISFSLKPLNIIIEEFDNGKLFFKCLENNYKYGEIPNSLNLDTYEIEFLSNYLNVIGKSDRESQINFIDGTMDLINEKLKSAEDDEKKYKKLYVKLGFLFGLLIFIVLL